MLKRTFVLVILVIVAALSFGCGEKGTPAPKPGEYVNITTDDAKEMIASDKNVVILDVRTPEEFQGGHIPAAVNVPGENLESAMGNSDKNSTIIVVCLSGARSELAARFLAQNGFIKVYNMSGGMQAWTGTVVQ